ncbi:hypothetical protein [Saccharopolyspora shandongensis]|uniref:hypothetical protein n=1 Tax=Saccharopolyspora shandongensis TaxID=418495 RepID=UPI00340FBA86
MTIELPPGDPGTPPHRNSGPVFGYMLEGEKMPRGEHLVFGAFRGLDDPCEQAQPG